MAPDQQSAADLYTSSLVSYFGKTDSHTAFQVYTQTKALFSNRQHVFVEDCSFPLRKFLNAKGYPDSIFEKASGYKTLKWDKGVRRGASHTADILEDGTLSFEYNNTRFDVFLSSWKYPDFEGSPGKTYHFVFDGEDDTPGKALVKEIYDWHSILKDEIWVFSHGWWDKDEESCKVIKSSSWDNIVLEDGFLKSIKSDTETFFASEEIYNSLKVTWKRGILLLGPPGNGKTQTIQAILKDALAKDIACLYVKTFASQRDDKEWGIRQIFRKARQEAPCILVLEDLDSMVEDKVRAYFLNELDGLENNHGIMIIATSNHPDKIDDAILRRPSRFDQKYEFKLPTLVLRKQYALQWLANVKQEGHFEFDSADIGTIADNIAEKTDDWSYAFLKELFVSFALRSASDRAARSKGIANGSAVHQKDVEVLYKQLELLSKQVVREGKGAIGSTQRTGWLSWFGWGKSAASK